MDTRSTLHWGALLLALYSLAWMLLSLVGGIIFLIPILALAGFLLVALRARRLPDDQRSVTLGAAWGGVALYALWVILRIASIPVTTEDSGGYDPPAILGILADGLTELLPGLGAILIALAFWPLWHQREQVLGGAGAAVVAVVTLAAFGRVGAGGDFLPMLFELLFAAGFLALAVALAFPILSPEQNKAVWGEGTA